MKRFLKLAAAVCAAAMLVVLVPGCGQSSSQGSSSQAQGSAVQSQAASSQKNSGPVTLRFSWWGGDARHKATLAAIAEYEKLYPNVKITGEYSGYSGYEQKLVTQLSGGTAPDIITVDSYWIYDLAAQGDMFANIYDQKGIDISSFNPNVLKSYILDDKLIGLPVGLNAFSLLHNKDMFKKMGIPEDTVWTWDNLLSVGSTVNKKDSSKYFLCQDSNETRLMLKAYIEQKTGKELINSDGTLGFDRATMLDALTYYKKLIDNKVIQSPKESAPFESSPTQNPKWINGDFCATIDYTSQFSVIQTNVKWQLGITKMPAFTDAKGKTDSVPSMFIALNKDSKQLEEAAKFVSWFFNDKTAANTLTDVRGTPPTETARKALISSNKLNTAVNKSLEAASVRETAYTNNSEITKIMLDEIEKIGYNGASPETITDEIMNSFNQKVKEIKNSK